MASGYGAIAASLALDPDGVNDVGTVGRSYFGGRSDTNALSTVDRPMPKSRAT